MQFIDLVNVSRAVAKTRSRIEKRERLAPCLREPAAQAGRDG